MNTKYAVALNRQSTYAPTVVGEFQLDPKSGYHIFRGKPASSMAELAEQVNAALAAVIDFRDPFLGIQVVEIKSEGSTPEQMQQIHEACEDARRRVSQMSRAEKDELEAAARKKIEHGNKRLQVKAVPMQAGGLVAGVINEEVTV